MWHSVTISFSNILNQKQKLDNFKINIFASKYEPVRSTVDCGSFWYFKTGLGPLSLFIVETQKGLHWSKDVGNYW